MMTHRLKVGLWFRVGSWILLSPAFIIAARIKAPFRIILGSVEKRFKGQLTLVHPGRKARSSSSPAKQGYQCQRGYTHNTCPKCGQTACNLWVPTVFTSSTPKPRNEFIYLGFFFLLLYRYSKAVVDALERTCWKARPRYVNTSATYMDQSLPSIVT